MHWRSVVVGPDRFLVIQPPGILLREVHRVLEYPFACKPKPRMTHNSRHRYVDYFSWVTGVRAITPEEIHEDVTLVLIVSGGIRSVSDVSNCLKAVEDALVGKAFADDNIKHLRTSCVHYERADEPSFTVILGR